MSGWRDEGNNTEQDPHLSEDRPCNQKPTGDAHSFDGIASICILWDRLEPSHFFAIPEFGIIGAASEMLDKRPPIWIEVATGVDPHYEFHDTEIELEKSEKFDSVPAVSIPARDGRTLAFGKRQEIHYCRPPTEGT